MAEPSYALHGYEIAGARTRIAKRIENCDAGTKQGRGLGGRKFVWDGGDSLGRGDHVFLITAVVADGGDLFVLAIHEIAAAAGVAGEIMTAVPSDARALAGFPVSDVGAYSVDATGDFVSGNTWILEAGPMAFLYERVAVTDTAGLDFDPDLLAGGFGNVSFDEFEITAGLADLDSFHFRHSVFLTNSGLSGGMNVSPVRLDGGRARTPGSPLEGSLELSLERVLGAVAGLGEIAVGTVLHGVGIAVAKLVGHGVVTGLTTFVRLFGTLAAVGIVQKMIARTFLHGKPFEASASIRIIQG